MSQYFSAGSFDLVVYPASLFIMPNQEKSLQGAKQILKPDGAVAASVLLGLKEQNQQALENLPAFKGIIKNDELPQLFAQYFSRLKRRAAAGESPINETRAVPTQIGRASCRERV